MRVWQGRCRSCAQQIATNKPEVRAAKSVRATAQCLRQGGIPNAVKYPLQAYKKKKQFRGNCITCGNQVSTHKAKRCKACALAYYTRERHSNWKGGITPWARSIRSMPVYVKWRKAIFDRDNYTCQICHKRGGVLHADHFPVPFTDVFHAFIDSGQTDASAYAPFWDTANGRTLCPPCHRKHGFNSFKHRNPRQGVQPTSCRLR